MRKMMSAFAALATAATAVVAMSGAAQAAPASGVTVYGCPSGAVCIYGEGVYPPNNPNPTNVYYSYGAHPLYNQYGYHYVLNNQYGGASASLCKTSSGTDCPYTIPQDYWGNYYLTPINSITLNRP
jgi:hypothetical protein